MKLRNYSIPAAALLLLGTSCAGEQPWGTGGSGSGRIDLTLSASGDLEAAVPVTRGVTQHIDAPDADDFSISLVKRTGGYSKTWNSLAEFKAESENKGFPMGSYDLEVFYGTPESQGHGKENSYFHGIQTEVMVLEQSSTTVDIQATLANSAVYVEYGEAFKKYFSNFSTTLQSEGHEPVQLGASEGEEWFIAPGKVDVLITGTNQNGQTLTMHPASFTLEAGHLHKLRYDVFGGQVGDAQLAITFDDALEADEVKVDLTDELFATNLPVVTPVGFEDGAELFVVQGQELAHEVKFNVMAAAGLKSAVLTVTPSSGGEAPAFGTSVDLIGADAATQAKLTEAGVKAMGFFRNPDKMALLDMGGFCTRLTAGVYTVSLTVTDVHGRAGQPVSFSVSAEPVDVSAAASSSVLGSGTAVITLSYNGAAPTGPGNNPFAFQAMDDYNYRDAEILSINDVPYATRAFETKDYAFKIRIPESTRTEIPVKVYFNGHALKDPANDRDDLVLTVNVEIPEYAVEVDAFATKAVFRISAADASTLSDMQQRVRLFVGGQEKTATFGTDHTATVTGLAPSAEYSWSTSVLKGSSPAMQRSGTFTTEAAAQVPNGDFSETEKTVNIDPINVGGPYTGTALSNPKYQPTSSIECYTPVGWATLNPITCYTEASNKNSWFVVPSTWSENGQVKVRSVGYSHNGTTPNVTKETGVHYCKNTPSLSDLTVRAGELFLGSYSFNGAEHRTDGQSWTSRPASLSFDYMYAPLNGEEAQAYVRILDASGNKLAEGNLYLEASSQMTTKTLAFGPYAFGTKAAKLELCFKSIKNGATPVINIPSGSVLSEGAGLSNKKLPANSYHAVATGSVLTVDNVKLEY